MVDLQLMSYEMASQWRTTAFFAQLDGPADERSELSGLTHPADEWTIPLLLPVSVNGSFA